VDNYTKTYAPLIHHISNKRHYEPYKKPLILPLEYKKSIGHSPSVRISDTMDKDREGHKQNRCVIANKLITMKLDALT